MICPKCIDMNIVCKEISTKGTDDIKQFVCPNCGTTYSSKTSRKKDWNIKVK